MAPRSGNQLLRAGISLSLIHILLEEDRLGDAKFGSTRRGIAPVYGDKYLKKAIRMGELKTLPALKERLKGIVEWKNLTVEGAYHVAPVQMEELWSWITQYRCV